LTTVFSFFSPFFIFTFDRRTPGFLKKKRHFSARVFIAGGQKIYRNLINDVENQGCGEDYSRNIIKFVTQPVKRKKPGNHHGNPAGSENPVAFRPHLAMGLALSER
jgi:hypothetical protein